MCCVYDGLETYNHYEPQQDTNIFVLAAASSGADGAAGSCERDQWRTGNSLVT
jgi:hypothetical protein